MTIALGRPTPLLADAADAWFDGIEDPVEQALAVLRWAGDTFGDEFAITSSMADGLLSHLASTAIPGVHVVFLDTGYHFAETIGTRDWITSRPADHAGERDPAADRGAAGRRVRPAAVRARPRPVLLAAQGAAAGGDALGLRRLGIGDPPRRVAEPRRHARSSTGTPSAR